MSIIEEKIVVCCFSCLSLKGFFPSSLFLSGPTMFRFRCKYLDRSSIFLPPSEYYLESHWMLEEGNTTNPMPTCQTPLSILCVVTSQTLELYLHGRYPLWKLPMPSTGSTTTPLRNQPPTMPRVVASHDLTHWVVLRQQEESNETAPRALAIYNLERDLRPQRALI